MKKTAIILASGKGRRLNLGYNKVFARLAGKSILAYSIEAFEKNKNIDEIIIVSAKENLAEIKKLIKKNKYSKINKVIPGGARRQDSSYNGVMSLDNPDSKDIVLIHDGARPFLRKKIINESILNTIKYGASVTGLISKNDIKEIDKKNFIKQTLNREQIFITQTPQAFRVDLIQKAHIHARKKKIQTNDEASLLEIIGKKVKVVLGDEYNIKITTPFDLQFAKNYVKNFRYNS